MTNQYLFLKDVNGAFQSLPLNTGETVTIHVTTDARAYEVELETTEQGLKLSKAERELVDVDLRDELQAIDWDQSGELKAIVYSETEAEDESPPPAGFVPAVHGILSHEHEILTGSPLERAISQHKVQDADADYDKQSYDNLNEAGIIEPDTVYHEDTEFDTDTFLAEVDAEAVETEHESENMPDEQSDDALFNTDDDDLDPYGTSLDEDVDEIESP